MRLVRAAVGELVLEQGSTLSVGGLREALPQAVGDPSLEVALWHEGSGTYRDRWDRPVRATEGGGQRASTRIEREGRPLALVLHDPALSGRTALKAAVESLAVRMPMRVEFSIDLGRCAPVVEATAYVVVCEALTNAARHARARHARVQAVRREDHLVVEVVDDGVGGANPGLGSGLG